MLAIKNMQMPKKCSECPMCKQSGIDLYCGADYVGIDNAFKKRDNCPLVEIVTCKDCEHCCHITDTPKVLLCEKHNCQQVSKNFYCKDGERRE